VFVCLFVFSQGGQLVGLMPVLAACHLIYVFSIVLHCISIHVVANKVLSLLMEEFQWNLAQIFIMWVGIAEKVFKVRGQRSRSWQDQCAQTCKCYNDKAYIYFTMWRQGLLVVL